VVAIDETDLRDLVHCRGGIEPSEFRSTVSSQKAGPTGGVGMTPVN
jgi:hypothetical protein